MTFLQPYILWGLPLLLIPVIIHLVNRLRHRPQPWAAMRFLRTATQSSVSQAKLRQFLVLLFRVLAVLALLFFLSRPLAGGWLGWALSPAPEVIVLVLDRSASMEARIASGVKTCREQVIELWSDALRPFENNSRLVLIDNASSRPQELPNIGSLQEPGFTGPTDTAADLPGLLQRTFNYLVDSKSGAAEVWIASDLQLANWNPEDSQWEKLNRQFSSLPQKVRFRLLSFEDTSPKNLSITLVDALRRERNQQSELEATVDLEHNEEQKDTVVLRSNINGAESETTVDLLGQTLRWRNVYPLGASTNAGWGSFQIAADGNTADNAVYFAYESARSVSSLVVTGESRSARPLRLAASDLSQESPQPALVIAPHELAGTSLSNVALVAWNAPLPEGLSADLLLQFVESGGALIFFPGETASTAQFAGLGWGELANAPSNQVFTVGKWNELDGPLARTEEGFGVPVGQLEISKRASISGAGTVLATFEDGAPFLIRKAAGRGEIYFCATSTRAEWSSLSEGPVLVPMLQRLLLNGSRRVNSPLLLSLDEIGNRDLTGWTPIEAQATRQNPKLHAGLYRVNERVVAVNRPPAENELQRLTAEDARKLFSNLPFRLHQEKGNAGDRLQGEVWRVFLILMLLFLMVEGLLVLPPAQPAHPVEELRRAKTKPQEAVA